MRNPLRVYLDSRCINIAELARYAHLVFLVTLSVTL